MNVIAPNQQVLNLFFKFCILNFWCTWFNKTYFGSQLMFYISLHPSTNQESSWLCLDFVSKAHCDFPKLMEIQLHYLLLTWHNTPSQLNTTWRSAGLLCGLHSMFSLQFPRKFSSVWNIYFVYSDWFFCSIWH